jgi:hypothetical protein
MHDLEELCASLDALGTGVVTLPRDVVDGLSLIWDRLDGGGEEGMHGGKIRVDRIESARWDPPVLTFDIERHGDTVMGSTRAKVHTWEVNLIEAKADLVQIKRRQLRPMARKLDVRPIADDIAMLIIAESNDQRLNWSKDRSSVRVMTEKCLGPACNQTMTERRKRFLAAVDEEVSPNGWRHSTQHGRWQRVTSP